MIDRPDFMIPEGSSPIEFLVPDSDQHTWVLAQLMARIRYSSRRMSNFHSRWRHNELMLQAYVSLPDYERILSAEQESGKSAGPVDINVPFAWATTNTIVTYLLHMFGGRKPIFTVGSYRPEQTKTSKNLELLLHNNADRTKFLRTLYFFLMDGETYGVAILRTLWKRTLKTRSILVPPDAELVATLATFGQAAPEATKEPRQYVAFEGNDTANVDPFMFFPDPRVPMHEVNEKGEFVFWRAFQGRHLLMQEQAAGRLRWVERLRGSEAPRGGDSGEGAGSARGMRAFGTSSFDRSPGEANISNNIQIDQGTILIVPSEWGLGSSKEPEHWMFSIGNEKQIIQAEKVELPSGKHPIEVAEPNSVGYSFGQLSTVDMLGPMQGMMSWFMNSHLFNVRSHLNNRLIVDPTKVEMQDLTNSEPGGVIRLKNTAFGLTDPKMAIQQLQVSDVTRSHLSDFQLFSRLASDLTGATDNVRGMQDAGGRKTATEIRTSAEAGASRLAAKGKIYSAMAITGLAEQWAANLQTNMTEEVELAILGSQAAQDTIRITPENIQGDFFFPVHDGTLPIDKIGMVDVWREILQAVLADPQLRQSFDVVSIFEWIAQLGGAQNIQSFRLNMVPQTQQMGELGAGTGVPMQQAMAALGGPA